MASAFKRFLLLQTFNPQEAQKNIEYYVCCSFPKKLQRKKKGIAKYVCFALCLLFLHCHLYTL